MNVRAYYNSGLYTRKDTPQFMQFQTHTIFFLKGGEEV